MISAICLTVAAPVTVTVPARSSALRVAGTKIAAARLSAVSLILTVPCTGAIANRAPVVASVKNALRAVSSAIVAVPVTATAVAPFSRSAAGDNFTSSAAVSVTVAVSEKAARPYCATSALKLATVTVPPVSAVPFKLPTAVTALLALRRASALSDRL